MALISKKTSLLLLTGIAGLMVVIGLLMKPLPQSAHYLNFADQRTWLGVPNAANVLSNIAISLAGVWGLWLLLSPGKTPLIHRQERWLWIGVALGFFLTGIGSAYFHLVPSNARLIADRFGIVIIMMSYVAALIAERINVRLGLGLWPLLLLIGFSSIFVWYGMALQGVSDLRFYAAVQMFAIVTTLVMLMTPSPYTRSWDLAVVVAFFALARLCEIYDHQIYQFTSGVVSGHTVKHLSAAMAGFWLMRMLWKRKEKKG